MTSTKIMKSSLFIPRYRYTGTLILRNGKGGYEFNRLRRRCYVEVKFSGDVHKKALGRYVK